MENDDNINNALSFWEETVFKFMEKNIDAITKAEDEAFMSKLLSTWGDPVPVRTFATGGTGTVKEYFISAGTYKINDGVIIKIENSEDTGETYDRNDFIASLQAIIDDVKSGAALDDVLSDLQDLHDDAIDSDDFADEDDDDADACPCAMCKCKVSEEVDEEVDVDQLNQVRAAALSRQLEEDKWHDELESAASSENANEVVISSWPKFGGIANKMGY